MIDVTNFHETPSMETLPDDAGCSCGCPCGACSCTDAACTSNSASPPIGSGYANPLSTGRTA
jgi:hypothetical protein